MVKLSPVTDSSVISGHAYDTEKRELHIGFKNGSRHVYQDVPLEKYAALTGAASAGRYFNKRIKPNHMSRKVSD